jgi:hypothetical protein
MIDNLIEYIIQNNILISDTQVCNRDEEEGRVRYSKIETFVNTRINFLQSKKDEINIKNDYFEKEANKTQTTLNLLEEKLKLPEFESDNDAHILYNNLESYLNDANQQLANINYTISDYNVKIGNDRGILEKLKNSSLFLRINIHRSYYNLERFICTLRLYENKEAMKPNKPIGVSVHYNIFDNAVNLNSCLSITDIFNHSKDYDEADKFFGVHDLDTNYDKIIKEYKGNILL